MDAASPDVTAFILAGGKSTRMGMDKAFVTLDRRMLLERALELARCVTRDVRIVGDSAKFASFAPVVEDRFRDCGPLAGIHAALGASTTELNLILAVDVPFVTPSLLQYMITRAKNSAATATVPRTNVGWHPLCAVYRRQFANAAEKALRAGSYKIATLFAGLQTQAVEEGELITAGFSAKMFRNLNTREELEAAKTEDVSQ